MNKLKKNITTTRFAFTRIKKATKAFSYEITKKENPLKGDIFEDYIRKKLFPNTQYKLVHRTPNFNHNDFNQSLLMPDFVFSSLDYEFAIEAKYRSNVNKDGCINICSNEEQLRRYKDFEKQKGIPVFILIGFSGTPYQPKELFLVPISMLFSHKLPKDYLGDNSISNKLIGVLDLKTAYQQKIKHGKYAKY